MYLYDIYIYMCIYIYIYVYIYLYLLDCGALLGVHSQQFLNEILGTLCVCVGGGWRGVIYRLKTTHVYCSVLQLHVLP